MDELQLTAGFPPADASQWLRLVEKVLAGRGAGVSDDPLKALETRTLDGFSIHPLYGQNEPGRQIPSNRATPGRWTVFQRVDHPDVDHANRLSRADLDGGANGLELIFPGSIRSVGFGIHAESLDDIDRLLADIDLSTTPLRIDAGYESRFAVAFLAALVERRGVDPATVEIAVLSDPIANMMSQGMLRYDMERVTGYRDDIVKACAKRGLRIGIDPLDARSVHGAGGSAAQELAYAISRGIEMLRTREKHGYALEDVAGSIICAMALDADQFMTIAKLRAVRRLWSRVLLACGLPDVPLRLHGQTAWRMMAKTDPWVNMLRVAVAAAAGGLGGVDSMTVLPFTLPLGLPDAFARRVARNTQLVLIEEAGLGQVQDPTAGSGYVEALTGQLCEAAWELVQTIEREGGLQASLAAGAFQARVAETAADRLRDIATHKTPLLGVSEFPQLKEVPARVLTPEVSSITNAGQTLDLPAPGDGRHSEAMIAEALQGATFADFAITVDPAVQQIVPLPPERAAAPFERLREASDLRLDRTGRRPSVYLATIGTPAEFAARCGFAENVFAAGGIQASGGTGSVAIDVLAERFEQSGAEIACICGTDAAYAETAEAMARALKSAGARMVFLAGKPGDRQAEWRAAGIDSFLHAGCDILACLEAAHTAIGLRDDDVAVAGSEEQ